MTLLKKILFIFLFLITHISEAYNDKKELFVKYTDNEIIVDGVLDESDWSLASPATNFYESFPNHGITSKNQINNINKFADGCVVGSAIVKYIENYSQGKITESKMLKNISDFLTKLKN